MRKILMIAACILASTSPVLASAAETDTVQPAVTAVTSVVTNAPKNVTVILDTRDITGCGRIAEGRRRTAERNFRKVIAEQKALGNTVTVGYANGGINGSLPGSIPVYFSPSC